MPSLPSAAAPRARRAIAVFFLVSGFGFATWASRIPALQQRLGLSEAGLGGVLFALPAGLLLTLPVTGLLLRRYSSRRIMLLGALLYNGTLGLLGFVQQPWQLVAVLFGFGCSRNLLNISMNGQSVGVQALYPRSIIASFHGIWSVAGFAAAAGGAFVIGAGIAPEIHLVAVAVGLSSLAGAFFPGSLPLPPAPGPAARPAFAWPDQHLLRFGLISFACMACEGTMYDWSGVYFQKVVPTAAGGVAAGFATYMVAMTVGRFTGDALATRFGVKPLLRGSGGLISLGLLVAAGWPTPLVAGLGFALVGLGVSCVVPMVFSLAGRSTTLGSGAAIAAVSTVGYLGFLIVPPLVGFLASALDLRWAFGLMAGLGLVIVGLVGKLE